MQFVNRFEVPTDLDEAWLLLGDVPRIAPCLPGATVEQIAEDTYRGGVTVKVGPIKARYAGQATVVRRDDQAHVMVLDAQGKEGSGKGSAAATITLELSPASDTVTRAKVTTDLTITGRLAQFGRSAMADVSQSLMTQFADNLAAQVVEPGAETDARPAAAVNGTASTDTPPVTASTSVPHGGASNELDAMTLMLPFIRRAVPAIAACAGGLAIGLLLGRRRSQARGSTALRVYGVVPDTRVPWPGCRH